MENTKVMAAEYGLEETQAQTIEQAFMPKIIERDGLKEVYEQILTKEITPEVSNEAKTIRLKLVKVRTGIAEIHKTQKAYFLAAGRFVDAWKNKETLPVEQMEENLKAIEEHYERIEAAKIAKLQQERKDELRKYQYENAFVPENLGTLTDEVWQNYLLGVKTAWEQKQAAEKAARGAEEKRIAEEKLHNERKEQIMPYWQFIPIEHRNDNFAILTEDEWKERFEWTVNEKKKHDAEQERIRKENEKLKKEAEERERLAKIEAEKRAKEEAERQAKAEAERKEREEKERKEREAHEAAMKAEREKAAKIQAELEAKAEAERKAKEAEAARIEAELNKGDADKVKDLVFDLEMLKSKYTFKSVKNRKMYADVQILIDKVINHINK